MNVAPALQSEYKLKLNTFHFHISGDRVKCIDSRSGSNHFVVLRRIYSLFLFSFVKIKRKCICYMIWQCLWFSISFRVQNESPCPTERRQPNGWHEIETIGKCLRVVTRAIFTCFFFLLAPKRRCIQSYASGATQSYDYLSNANKVLVLGPDCFFAKLETYVLPDRGGVGVAHIQRMEIVSTKYHPFHVHEMVIARFSFLLFYCSLSVRLVNGRHGYPVWRTLWIVTETIWNQ